jgi:hemolysin III
MSPRTSKIKDPVSGFTHLAGCALAFVGAAWLLAHERGDTGAVACVAIYGVCLVTLYAASSAYHLIAASERTTRALRLFDHIAIFLMVAGTCTPIYYRAFSGGTRLAMLAAIWLAAVVGIVFKLAWPRAPRALYTAIYIVMGWGIVFRGAIVVASLPHAATALIVAGGLTYTAGAIVYMIRRPNPLPKVFGFHEIWHLFVLGGSALHYGAIALLT